ncbi:hypothetical protein K470DRAFT_262011 [Piedraia hortae CBS 480.64]|uniref:Uncharacterized protein n=1 Tax=Piedraia hortae CBS 480.64 TaxID=1314780 RepID=A0A6A7C9G2_9PEZI|nr:hypothetical protein K470DRAFT_262011 [Piedraia hortae CBS 480.64]
MASTEAVLLDFPLINDSSPPIEDLDPFDLNESSPKIQDEESMAEDLINQHKATCDSDICRNAYELITSSFFDLIQDLDARDIDSGNEERIADINEACLNNLLRKLKLLAGFQQYLQKHCPSGATSSSPDAERASKGLRLFRVSTLWSQETSPKRRAVRDPSGEMPMMKRRDTHRE